VRKRVILFSIPMLVIGLPLGMGNALSQPLSAALLTPLVYLLIPHAPIGVALASLVVLVTIARIVPSGIDDYSIYQAVRSGLPFVYFCVLLGGFRRLSRFAEQYAADRPRSDWGVHRLLLFFAAGQFIQVTLHQLGIDAANVASESTENAWRLMLYPTTATLLIFFFSWRIRNWSLLAMTGYVLLATGSKTALTGMAVMALLASWDFGRPRRMVAYAALASVAVATLLQLNFVAFERLTDFLLEDRGVDVTREYEIGHASKSFQTDESTIVFGNGLAHPLTPGVPSNDERWFENSKYDIENAYWALLAKLGLLGISLLLWLYFRLPINRVTLATVLVFVLYAFKTSYQFFTTFDGCYLLVVSALILSHRAFRSPLPPTAVKVGPNKFA